MVTYTIYCSDPLHASRSALPGWQATLGTVTLPDGVDPTKATTGQLCGACAAAQQADSATRLRDAFSASPVLATFTKELLPKFLPKPFTNEVLAICSDEQNLVGEPGCLVYSNNGTWRRVYDGRPVGYPAPSPPSHGDRLLPGEGLLVGQSITSEDGRFTFTIQSDANLVLYFGADALWNSGTSGHASPKCVIMWPDGRLIAFDAGGVAYWASPASDGPYEPESWFVLQTDGNSVVYTPSGGHSWNSGTYGH